MKRLKFSGHESFVCKQSWLRKGLQFLEEQGRFGADDAVVKLGVGKNMVASIRFWLKAFGLIDESDQTSDLAQKLFGDKAWDPFVEEIGTTWLLHYQLVSTQFASAYDLFFNKFQVGRHQFSKEQLKKYLIRVCEESSYTISEKSLDRDILVLIKSYLKPKVNKKSDLEDDFSRLLIELDLIHSETVTDIEDHKTEYLAVNWSPKPSLPWQVVLYTILDQMEADDRSVSFDKIHKTPHSPGIIFSLSEDALMDYIEAIVNEVPAAVYSETAGNRVLQFNTSLDKYEVLDGYFRS